jgi:hypothetical protein
MTIQLQIANYSMEKKSHFGNSITDSQYVTW